jgi:hypothetical protein
LPNVLEASLPSRLRQSLVSVSRQIDCFELENQYSFVLREKCDVYLDAIFWFSLRAAQRVDPGIEQERILAAVL